MDWRQVVECVECFRIFLFFLPAHLEAFLGTREKKEFKFTRRTRRLDAGPYFTWLFGATGGRHGVGSPGVSIFFRPYSTATDDFHVHWNITSAVMIELIVQRACKSTVMASSFVNSSNQLLCIQLGLSLLCFTDKSGSNHNVR
jgi:hypothetical protein